MEEKNNTNHTNDEQVIDEESKEKQKPKTIWDKINAFFKNPLVFIIVAALAVGVKYIKVNNRHNSNDYHDAKEAYEKKDYQTALKLFEKVCNESTLDTNIKKISCTNTGYMYKKGLGTSKNTQKAYNFYIRACDELKYGYSCAYLARMLDEQGNTKEANKYLKKACEYGEKDSCN